MSKQRKQNLQNIVSGRNYLPLYLPGQSPRGRNIYSWPYSLWVQAAKLPVLTVYRVGFANPTSNLIGQPFYNARRILRRVASVAGASAAATLTPIGRGAIPMPPRPGNPVEGNGLHTWLKVPSHHVEGWAVNCPLSGPAWEDKWLPHGRAV
jgi:hypothetical protein